MPSYSPTVNPGDERRRVWRNTNDNPLGGIPIAIIHEQDVVKTAAGPEVPIDRAIKPIEASPTPELLATVLPLRNPDTDQVIGQSTVQMAYVHWYSLLRLLQERRDAEPPQPNH